MPKAVGRAKADLQKIALLGANGVRPIAAARMGRQKNVDIHYFELK
jgi:hypothetical protein